MSNRDFYLEKLKELIAFPTVSATKTAQPETAEYLKNLFQGAGADEVITDDEFGAPFILAKFLSKNINAKTLVIYNHYDVQPAEPFDLWESDPFTLTQRDGKLYGRGVDDDKGHITARLTAVTDFIEENNGLPVNIFWILEGSEESASVGLDKYTYKYKDEFSNVDLILWESGGINEDGNVEIVGGNKGIITFTLSSKSANSDIHSSYSAVIDSATWHLIAAINSLRNPDGTIAIEGLYDDAIKPTERELELSNKSKVTPDSVKKNWGLKLPLYTERNGEDFNFNLYFRSALNIEGFISGYNGQGVKTVLPAEASAKLEIRLVPGQIPEDIFNKVRKQLDANGFTDINAELTLGQPGYRSDMSAPAIQKLVELSKELYGGVEVYPTSAGTGPMYFVSQNIKAPIATTGISYSGSLDHAPNENIRLADYDKHIELIKELIKSYE